MSNQNSGHLTPADKNRKRKHDVLSILIWVVLFVVAFYAIILIGLGNSAFIYKDV